MFAPMIKATTICDKTEQLKQVIDDLKKMDVLVGIPQKEDTRKGDPVTNAQLLFIHTKGSPLHNIPARPVIEPAIEDDKAVIAELLSQALIAALDGNAIKAMEYLNKAGLEGEAASKDWFTNPKNGWAPNSLKVQQYKIKKGSTEPKPLIDTGELRKSITYVIRKK